MIYADTQKLIQYAVQNNLIHKEDIYVIRNQFMSALRLYDWQECSPEETAVAPQESIDDILAPLLDYACREGLIRDTAAEKDRFDTRLMGFLTPMPREITAEFQKRYEESPENATDWYYSLNKKLNYVRAGRMARDLKWTCASPYGVLDVTINCSKPEKDPRDIAAARKQRETVYPRCPLCPENAGFHGGGGRPARYNLRPIPVLVRNEPWEMQYSPYGYYNEHCIVFNTRHTPMVINASVFEKLFDLVDYLPHYFFGSNADLPIVGGSILSHEHFQGGHYTFAMDHAPIERELSFPAFPSVRAGIVRWPMSVIRLTGEDRQELAACADHILRTWRAYSDEAAGIFARTEDTPHNTVTPIAHKNGTVYTCDLVLRNNITTPERPLGVFHPNPSLHHIKKENIGLIEVMGLAVLPGRLAKEISLLEQAMLAGDNLRRRPELEIHADWAEDILRRHPEFSAASSRSILEQEIGAVYLEVLLDAGVFKRTPEGQAAFLRFTDACRN